MVTKLEVTVTDREAVGKCDLGQAVVSQGLPTIPGAGNSMETLVPCFMAQRATPIGSVLMLLICATAPARSELPPWAYGDDQRRAPVVVELQVDQSQARGQLQVLRARLRSIRRQPLGLLLRPGTVIEIVYAIPPQRSGGWAGPSPIPVLPAGRQTLAWLRPLPATTTAGLRRFEPAAGGKSFGPSLEEAHESLAPGQARESMHGVKAWSQGMDCNRKMMAASWGGS